MFAPLGAYYRRLLPYATHMNPDALTSCAHALAWPWQRAHRCVAALAVDADALALACDGSGRCFGVFGFEGSTWF